jgi:YhcH/YjgK/YiaL family protein
MWQQPFLKNVFANRERIYAKKETAFLFFYYIGREIQCSRLESKKEHNYMIIDTIDNIERYASLHPDFPKIFNLLRTMDLNSQPKGRMNFEGERFYINIDEVPMRGKDEAFPEVHNRYIDIQVPITATETIGYLPRTQCHTLQSANEEKDIAFYRDEPASYFELRPGCFAIFFPEDAHAPIIGNGITRKAIVKVEML